jgi:predicted glycoside hydrolase/deacetylase ChbG (UPF0249 family)
VNEPVNVIFNADDFGASRGINRGIVEAHVNGVVTSTSCMVTGAAITEAVSLSREHPKLAIGLHWDVLGEDDEPGYDLGNVTAVKEEFRRQLGEFERLFGRLPTHIDSHRHAHLKEHLLPVFKDMVVPFGLPLRGDGQVKFTGGFYAQWEWKVTDLAHVSVAALTGILKNEMTPGWNEVSCHPGYKSPDFTSIYLAEREAELRTLTDPAIKSTLDALGYRLASYAELSL